MKLRFVNKKLNFCLALLPLIFSSAKFETPFKINKVILQGVETVDPDAVKAVLPFSKDDVYSKKDVSKAIKKIDALGRFDKVSIAERLDNENKKVDLKISVVEKKILKGFEIEGNSVVTNKKIISKTGLGSLDFISDHDVKVIIKKIEDEYKANNYLGVVINYDLEVADSDPRYLFLKIKVKEGVKTSLKRVNFYGLKDVPESVIRPKIMTREGWLFSALDNSGKLNREFVENDSKIIEEIYQNRGYIQAEVVNTRIRINEAENSAEVDFFVKEGNRFKVRFVTLPENDKDFSSFDLKRKLSIHRGDFYSKEKVIESIGQIKRYLGNYGYIFADVRPDVKNVEGKDEVDIDFYVEKGESYTIDNIEITGNKNTKDSVIRRELCVNEGDLVTSSKLDLSKYFVESLGYFESDQVDWKKTIKDGNKVDLELNVKEARTGNGNLGATFGSDHASSVGNFKIFAELRKRNFAGMGWDVSGNVHLGANKLQSGGIQFVNPHIFDSNVYFAYDAYLKRAEYEGYASYKVRPLEETKGVITSLGFNLFPYQTKIQTLFEAGIENIDFIEKGVKKEDFKASRIGDLFESTKTNSGFYNWLGLGFVRDTKNHPLYPSAGYKAELKTKLVLPAVNENYNMIKTEFEARHYLSLVKKERLVFASRLKLGVVGNFSGSAPIPNKELYHMGGPDSIRGFRWGEAGPVYKERTEVLPVGAKNSFITSFELITPMTFSTFADDYTPRAYLFCDLGCGWNHPFDLDLSTEQDKIVRDKIFNQDFKVRKTVGWGIRLTSPYPIQISQGFKLDRNLFTRERSSETHIVMNIPF